MQTTLLAASWPQTYSQRQRHCDTFLEADRHILCDLNNHLAVKKMFKSFEGAYPSWNCLEMEMI